MITYEILRVDTWINQVQVNYTQGDRSYITWVYLGDVPVESLTEEIIHNRAQLSSKEAVDYWAAQDAQNEFSKQIEVSLTTKTGVAKPWIYEEMPVYDAATHKVEVKFTETEEACIKGWDVVELTEGERAYAIRQRRDALLASCDLECLSDRTPSQEILTYRQALRDITTQAGFPTNVIWPIKPHQG